jgi:hypothetical protein
MIALGLEHVLAGALDVLATEGGVVEYLLTVGTRAALKIRCTVLVSLHIQLQALFKPGKVTNIQIVIAPLLARKLKS